MALYSSFGACSAYGQCGTCDAVYPGGDTDGGGGGGDGGDLGPTPPGAISPEPPLPPCGRTGLPWWGWLLLGIGLGTVATD